MTVFPRSEVMSGSRHRRMNAVRIRKAWVLPWEPWETRDHMGLWWSKSMKYIKVLIIIEVKYEALFYLFGGYCTNNVFINLFCWDSYPVLGWYHVHTVVWGVTSSKVLIISSSCWPIVVIPPSFILFAARYHHFSIFFLWKLEKSTAFSEKATFWKHRRRIRSTLPRRNELWPCAWEWQVADMLGHCFPRGNHQNLGTSDSANSIQ